ncbi:Cyclin-dependent kinase 10 [Quaeritorhiza haematococci]|nr:Cyclin-dependent kinase 10 [Quaeritorhiza haematococci]
MEYCEQDMANLMDNVISQGPQKGYQPAEVKCLMYQLLKGVEYLHDNYIIHRDLKLSNLLLTSKGTLKIADFGLARKFGTPTEPMTPRVVTLWYRAPELLFGEKNYTTAVDMWAVGCIFGELLRSQPLLPGKTERMQIDLIIDLLGTPNSRIWPSFSTLPLSQSIHLKSQPFSNLKARFSTPNLPTNSTSAASPQAIALLNGLLTYDPKKRMTVKEALRHPYFVEEGPGMCRPEMLPTYPEIRNGEESGRGRARRQYEEERRKKDRDERRERERDGVEGEGEGGGGGVDNARALGRRGKRVNDDEDEAERRFAAGRRRGAAGYREDEDKDLPLGVPVFKQFQLS